MTQQTSGDTVDLSSDEMRRMNGMLRTTWFDSVTSFLTALVLFLGTLVLALLVLWMLSDERAENGPVPPPKIVLGTVNPKGFERDFLEPGAAETVDLSAPNMQDSLLAVTDVVSHVAASAQTNLLNQPGKQGERGDGDSRPLGPSDGTDDVVPRFERWQLNFTARDLHSYARQLDHYEIELGLIGGGIQGLDYASSLASEQPQSRHGDSRDEKRLYFIWTQAGPLMQFDRQLLQRAFVSAASDAEVEKRQLLKFISPELENRLAKIELEYAIAKGHSTIDSISKTVFISRPQGDGYQFLVAGQRYRKQKD
jgi:hypothetical protein